MIKFLASNVIFASTLDWPFPSTSCNFSSRAVRSLTQLQLSFAQSKREEVNYFIFAMIFLQIIQRQEEARLIFNETALSLLILSFCIRV